MLPREIKIGHVLSYSYLWLREMREGGEEGRKDRPCVVLVLVGRSENGADIVRVLPVTHSIPDDPEVAMELPSQVKERLRLDGERSWVILTESNKFAWPGPDIRRVDQVSSDGYYGPLPPKLFDQIRSKYIELVRRGHHSSVPRTE
jgi:hypothetical protein